ATVLIARGLGPLAVTLAASTAAQAQFNAAVLSGRAVALDSAKAAALRAAAVREVAAADLAATNAELLRVRASISRSVAIKEGNTAEFARITLRKQLDALEARRLVQLGALTAAENAHTAAVARTGLAARAAGASILALRSAMAFFGGPVGVAITAVAAGMYLFSSNTAEAEDSTLTFKTAMDGLNSVLQTSEQRMKNLALAERERIENTAAATLEIKKNELAERQRQAAIFAATRGVGQVAANRNAARERQEIARLNDEIADLEVGLRRLRAAPAGGSAATGPLDNLSREFNKVRDTLAAQVDAQRKLVESYGGGADAILRAREAIELLSRTQSINEKFTDAQRAAVAKLMTQMQALQKQTAEAALRRSIDTEIQGIEVLIRNRGIETAEIRTQIELMRIRNELGSEAAARAEDSVRALERQRETLAAIRRETALRQDLQLIEKELSLVGENVDVRTKEMALLRAKIDLQNRGISLTSHQAQRELELTATIADRRSALERVQRAHEELAAFADRAFDRIGSAITEMFVQGERDAVDWRDVMRGVISEVIQEFIKLGAIAPIKNALFGSNSSTLSDVGGVFGKIFSSIFHGGGVVGETAGPGRAVPAAAFVGAPRLHNGLAPDEFPAILQRGEEVIPRGGSSRSGNTINVYPDLRGASVESVQALHRMVRDLDASIEPRSVSAIKAERFANPGVFGGKS
ncbi:MAG: hypothetical protein WD407_04445, partial [Rhodospirillales bacterium]